MMPFKLYLCHFALASQGKVGGADLGDMT